MTPQQPGATGAFEARVRHLSSTFGIGGVTIFRENAAAVAREADARVAELEAKIAALRKDAERYAYLRSLSTEVPTRGLDVAWWEDFSGEGIRGEVLDAAIDAAIASTQPAVIQQMTTQAADAGVGR